MGIIISSCLNESETEVVPVNQVRRIFYGIISLNFIWYYDIIKIANNILFYIQGLKCPVCSKFILPDDIECHLVMCLTKPRLSYNGEFLFNNYKFFFIVFLCNIVILCNIIFLCKKQLKIINFFIYIKNMYVHIYIFLYI